VWNSQFQASRDVLEDDGFLGEGHRAECPEVLDDLYSQLNRRVDELFKVNIGFKAILIPIR